ncbi:hypothetical protein ACFLU6_07460 [Acidobacteriota bacterium]
MSEPPLKGESSSKEGPFYLRNGAWIIGAIHFAWALVYRIALGMRMGNDPIQNSWDFYWQTLPMEALREDLWGSLLVLHAQPPLLNLLGGILGKLFYPHHLEALQGIYMILGAVMAGCTYLLLRDLSGFKRPCFWLALVFAANPSLFLFEAYILYTLPSAFLIMMAVTVLSRPAGEGARRGASCESAGGETGLIAFIVILNLLILIRSLYHPVLLILFIPLACVVAGRDRWKRVLVISLALSSISIAWSVKNLVMFDFFGNSSWMGQGFYRMASQSFPEDRIDELIKKKNLNEAVRALSPFSKPAAYRSYGFNRESHHPLLDRDDKNNINMPDISGAYKKAAIAIILDRPGLYLRNVHATYVHFCLPSSRYKHVAVNRNKIGRHVQAWLSSGQGQRMFDGVRRMTGREWGSPYYVLLPLSVVIYMVSGLLGDCSRREKLHRMIQQDPAMVFSALIIVYTIVAGCCFERGENERFRFMIEPLSLCFFAVLILRVARRR